MSFSKDSKKVEMLSDEDQAEIASQLLKKDHSFLFKLLNTINGGYDLLLHQPIEERNSFRFFNKIENNTLFNILNHLLLAAITG